MTALLNNEQTADSENKDAAMSMLADKSADVFNAKLAALKEEGYGTAGIASWSNSSNTTAVDAFNKYAEAAGLSNATFYDV
jgi:hypothetical protein